MPEAARKGVIVCTDSGNLKHEDVDGWAVDPDGDLNVFEGDNTVATYRHNFWRGIAFDGVTKPV